MAETREQRPEVYAGFDGERLVEFVAVMGNQPATMMQAVKDMLRAGLKVQRMDQAEAIERFRKDCADG